MLGEIDYWAREKLAGKQCLECGEIIEWESVDGQSRPCTSYGMCSACQTEHRGYPEESKHELW